MTVKKVKYTEDELTYIKNNINTKTCKEIGNVLGRHPVGVQTAIKKYLKVSKKPVHTNRPDVTFDHNTAKLLDNSLESYYWLGFLAADGNIYKGKRCRYNRLSIGVQEKDLNHLNKLISFLEYTGNLMHRPAKNFYIIYLRINEEERAYLSTFTIVPNKSLILKPPSNLTYQQSLAYIKGYIDGDGCVFLTGKYKNLLNINIVGTKEMLDWIASTLKSNHKITSRNNIFSITITGQTARDIKELFLNLNTPHLTRKWKLDISKN